LVYFIVRDAEDFGFDGKYFEAVGIRVGGKLMGTSEFLADTDNFKRAAEESLQVKLVWLPSMGRPVLAVPEDVDVPANYVQVDDVYMFVNKYFNKETNGMPTELYRKIETMVRAKYADASDRVLACYGQLLYLSGSGYDRALILGADKILGGNYFIATQDHLNRHNAGFSSVFQSLDASENVTLFQRECTDPLFIEIPDRNLLLNTEPDDITKLIPSGKEVSSPYQDRNAYSPKYREKGVPRHLIPMIEGNPDNNGLGIQENEQKYYSALMDWVAYNVRQEFDFAEEGIREGTVTIDGLSQDYLTELADHIYSWYWSHNLHMPLSMSAAGDWDSGDSSMAASRYEYREEAVSGGVIENAVLSLNSYLEEASAKLGYRVYVEAVIKLARWGGRKPTALSFDGYPIMFDLATNRGKQNIGSISDYQLRQYDGCQYRLTGAITIGAGVADKTFGVDRINVPVGIIGTSLYVNEDRELKVPTYFSMFDAIPAIKDGTLKIQGIKWDGEAFGADGVQQIPIADLVDDYQNNSDQFLQNPFSKSNEMKELCIGFGVRGGETSQNIMSILNEAVKDPELHTKFEKFKMKDISELQGMIMSGVSYSTSAILTANLAKIALPVVLKVEGDSLGECLNSWDRALASWKGLKSFYVKEPVTVQENQGRDVRQGTPVTGAMDVFSAEKGVQPSSPKAGQEMQGALLRALPASVAKAIVNEDGEVIGGYMREKATISTGETIVRFIAFDKETWDSLKPEGRSEQSVYVFKLFPYFVDDLARLMSGNAEKAKLLFNSVKSIHQFTLFFKRLADKKEAAVKSRAGQ